MDFRAPHPLVHPSHAGHPYYYPGIFFSATFPLSSPSFSLSLSLSLFLCVCRSLALFLFSGILVYSYLSGLLDILVSLRESLFAIARVDSRSATVSSLSPKFLASTIDVRCSRRLVEGEKRSGR